MHRLFVILFWVSLVGALTIASIPNSATLTGETNDKLQHVIAFTVLAVLARLAFPHTSLGKLLVSLSVFGALIEIIQFNPALGRDAEFADWIADTLASGIAFGAIFLFERSRPSGGIESERDEAAGAD